jgi:hypothetical protein
MCLNFLIQAASTLPATSLKKTIVLPTGQVLKPGSLAQATFKDAKPNRLCNVEKSTFSSYFIEIVFKNSSYF